jgi:hypothetical protein
MVGRKGGKEEGRKDKVDGKEERRRSVKKN